MIKLKLEEKTLKPAPPVLQLITRQILPKTNNLLLTVHTTKRNYFLNFEVKLQLNIHRV